MNEKQAELVVELMQEGFMDEAQILAQAYDPQSFEESNESNEKVAGFATSLKFITKLILRNLPFIILKTAIKQASQLLFPGIQLQVRKVFSRTISLFINIASLLGSILLLIIYIYGLHFDSKQKYFKKFQEVYDNIQEKFRRLETRLY